MTTQNSRVFTRCSPAIILLAVLLAFLTFNTASQAQVLPDYSAAGNSSAVFTAETTPNPGLNNFLFGISGDSETDIWAVGTFASGALGLHFDGTTWKSVPMALPTTADMRGASVLSAADVWSVGSVFNSNTQHFTSVIQHFDGTNWSLVPGPQFSTGSQLFAVKAFSSTDVFAVGESHSDSQKPNPLVEHFDGTRWSVVPTPHFQDQTVSLSAIAAVSDTDVWVTGVTSSIAPVIMHFDGKQFSTVPFPVSNKTVLGELAAIATNDVWVVGFSSNSTTGTTLTAHWDGTAWTVVPSPNLTKNDSLGAVAAISSTDVWAAGCAPCGSDIGIGQVFLIEHWDGTQWTIDPTPLIGKGDIPTSILAFPSGGIYVAGTSAGGTLPFETLVLHTTQGN
jgi:hypothetical protein